MCAACGLKFKWMLPIPDHIEKFFVLYIISHCFRFFYRMQARKLHYSNCKCNLRYYNTICSLTEQRQKQFLCLLSAGAWEKQSKCNYTLFDFVISHSLAQTHAHTHTHTSSASTHTKRNHCYRLQLQLQQGQQPHTQAQWAMQYENLQWIYYKHMSMI